MSSEDRTGREDSPGRRPRAFSDQPGQNHRQQLLRPCRIFRNWALANAGPSPVRGPRRALRRFITTNYERFQCTAGLGALTREQILGKGWKVDFVEKIPPPPDQPAQSPRGLPLHLYKRVISRYGG